MFKYFLKIFGLCMGILICLGLLVAAVAFAVCAHPVVGVIVLVLGVACFVAGICTIIEWYWRKFP